MTTEHKLAAVVAKRHGLTAEEASELRGRTLSELASHARHLIGRRAAVAAAKERHPGTPDYVIEGQYDGGGFAIDDNAGKELAAQALSDRVKGADPQTRSLLGRIGQRALARKDDSERRARITERLRAAGFDAEGA